MGDLSRYLERKPIFKAWLPAFGVFEREVRRFFLVPAQTILGPLASAFIYFGLFGLSFGKVFDDSSTSLSNGVPYILFLIPGIMAMETVTASIQNPLSSIMISKWSGTVVDLLMAPLSSFTLWLAYVFGACVRSFIVAASVFIAGSICAHNVPNVNIPLILAASFLAVAIFSSLGLILGILCKTWDQAGIIMAFVIQPLTFFSGVFFSFEFLPAWLQFVKYLNPVFYIVSMFRYAVLRSSDISIYLSFSMSLCFLCFMFVCAHFAISKKLGIRS